MTPLEIYHAYHLPPALQQHMLQVTAVGMSICQNWHGPAVDQETIKQALLLHDLCCGTRSSRFRRFAPHAG